MSGVTQQFRDASAGALAALSGQAPAPQPTQQTPPPSAPPVAAPAQTTATPPPAPAPEPTPTELSDDALVQLADGQVVPWKEARSGYLRHADYTVKTQQLAEQRRQVEALTQLGVDPNKLAEFAQAMPQIEGLLGNPRLLAQYVRDTFGPEGLKAVFPQSSPQAPTPGEPVDPNAPVTVAQLNTLLRQREQAYQQELTRREQAYNQRLSASEQKLRYDQQVQSYVPTVNQTVQTTLAENPALQTIPEMERILRDRVSARQPSTVEQMKQFFQEEAAAQVDALRAQFVQAQQPAQPTGAQQQVTTSQNLAASGIQPPGGIGPSGHAPAQFVTPRGKVDWKATREGAIARLQSRMGG